MKSKVLLITQAAMIAAIYVAMTLFIQVFNLASGAIQVRISEALTILPAFTIAAVPGLFIGCLISNLITGCMPLDVVFGSLATLIGAVLTYVISHGYWKFDGKKRFARKFLAPLPPIISNTIIVPFVLAYVYAIEGTIPFFMLTVGAGEIISCGVIGIILMLALEKYRGTIFSDS